MDASAFGEVVATIFRVRDWTSRTEIHAMLKQKRAQEASARSISTPSFVGQEVGTTRHCAAIHHARQSDPRSHHLTKFQMDRRSAVRSDASRLRFTARLRLHHCLDLAVCLSDVIVKTSQHYLAARQRVVPRTSQRRMAGPDLSKPVATTGLTPDVPFSTVATRQADYACQLPDQMDTRTDGSFARSPHDYGSSFRIHARSAAMAAESFCAGGYTKS